ncbi:hypothetical protein ACFLTI_00120 [Bacteroidota bacterium]
MGLLRTLAILIIIYYVGKFFARYIFPIFLRNYIKKMAPRADINNNFKEEKSKKKGEVTVEYKPESNNKTINKESGDYVDFEEVE